MEARQTLKGTSVSKGLIAIMAVGATVGLAAIGSIAANNLGNSAATQTSAVHAAPGTVLRQDNPVRPALAPAQAVKHSGRSAGTQLVEEGGASIVFFPAAGTVLRQDNPVQPALSSAQAARESGRSAGNQWFDGATLADGSAGGPDSDLTRALPQEAGIVYGVPYREHGV